MLIRNPMTEYLYHFGYNGIENIYEYWKENREALIQGYTGAARKKDTQKDLEAFKYKIRWGSSFALFIRMGIDRAIRNTQGEVFAFDTIEVRYGKQYLGIKDFSQKTMPDNPADLPVDLRGISVLDRTFEKVILKDIDFSFAALNGCQFHGVIFRNCLFDRTGFEHVRFLDCRFEDTCVVRDCNFTNSLLDAQFECNVIRPKINSQRFWNLRRFKDRKLPLFLNYTVIKDRSFGEKCDDEEVRKYVTWQTGSS